MEYLIYLHKNKINGKCYVGQTCQKPEDRWGINGNGYKNQPYFYRAIQKYGWDNFAHIILEEHISVDKVNEREQFWAQYYNALAPNGYTLYVGNQNHYIDSEELHKIKSEAMKKVWQNEEYKNNINLKRKEQWQEQGSKTREICLQNLDRSGKGAAARAKKVLCIETNIIYNSTREAERLTGVSHNNISQVCNGKRQSAGKLHWRFIEE